MKYISLFAGIGGFDLALNRLGHECVYANDFDKYCKITYDKNFVEAINGEENRGSQKIKEIKNSERYKKFEKINTKRGQSSQYSNSDCTGQKQAVSLDTRSLKDVPTSDIPDHDLLVGGFPCQSFSIAGKRRGFDDTRGTLFFDIARIAKDKKPKYMLLENVKGLVSHDKGRTLTTILETLQEMGYYVNWEIHNSKDYGVPQNRERIFLLCKHISVITSVGQNQKITSSEKIIQEYLFQLLLNNLKEVQKLQEHALKDWVAGWLLLKEINQSLKSNGENTMDGIMTPTAEGIFQSKAEEVWQSIDTWLSKNLGVDCSEPNIYTISTVIKRITESETYTFLQMQECIWLATAVLRKLQPDLWNQVLLSLTVIQEGTKYARINNQNKKIIITENSTAHDPAELQDPAKYFSLGHLRGEPRPKIFPISTSDQQDEFKGILAHTLNSSDWRGGNRNQKQTTIMQLNQPKHSNERIYGEDGISPTLNTMQGGGRQPFVAMRWNRTEKGKQARRESQRLGKDNTPFNDGHRELKPATDGIIGTITSQAIAKDSLLGSESQVRRLTPLECERLQGFPDGWTEFGVIAKGQLLKADDPDEEDEIAEKSEVVRISDTQRYKQLGNAVTVNVVYEVARRL